MFCKMPQKTQPQKRKKEKKNGNLSNHELYYYTASTLPLFLSFDLIKSFWLAFFVAVMSGGFCGLFVLYNHNNYYNT